MSYFVHCDVCEAEFPTDLVEVYNSFPVCSRCAGDLEGESLALVDEHKRLENKIIDTYTSNRLMTYEEATTLFRKVDEWVEEQNEIEAELYTVHGISLG